MGPINDIHLRRVKDRGIRLTDAMEYRRGNGRYSDVGCPNHLGPTRRRALGDRHAQPYELGGRRGGVMQLGSGQGIPIRFIVPDRDGQALAYVHYADEPGRLTAAKL